jgi:hypothetical protein
MGPALEQVNSSGELSDLSAFAFMGHQLSCSLLSTTSFLIPEQLQMLQDGS